MPAMAMIDQQSFLPVSINQTAVIGLAVAVVLYALYYVSLSSKSRIFYKLIILSSSQQQPTSLSSKASPKFLELSP